MDKEKKRRQRRAEREYLNYMQELGMPPGEAPYALAMSYLMTLANEILTIMQARELVIMNIDRARELSKDLTEDQLGRANLREVMDTTLTLAQRVADGEELDLDHPDVRNLHSAIQKGRAIMSVEESGGLN